MHWCRRLYIGTMIKDANQPAISQQAHQPPTIESTPSLCSSCGGLAQLVERVLSMHEVSGSIPEFSNTIRLFVLICSNFP